MNPGDTQGPYELGRFVEAQQDDYEQALCEIKSGQKTSHWMSYIFPQFDALGSSAMSRQFSIKSIEGAKASLLHPILGPRIVDCGEAVHCVEGRSVHEIFGSPDDLKLRACITLFSCVSPSGSVFHRLLDKYYEGQPHHLTLGRQGIEYNDS